jgi:hypothetical protein
MENSEVRKRIINLGKALVEELKLNPGVDTFSRWMVHYVAEQITIAETATGDKKRIAEQRCFETILKLWQHRSALPNGHRPFESFEPIFRALARLDPDNPTPYFFSERSSRSSETDKEGDDAYDVQEWLDIARGIDQGSRAMLEFVFYQAALNATDAKTIMWLKNAVWIPPNEDVSIIVRVINGETDKEDEETSEKQKRSKQEKLMSRIKQLDAFIEFSQDIRASYVAELDNLIPGDSSTDMIDDTNS